MSQDGLLRLIDDLNNFNLEEEDLFFFEDGEVLTGLTGMGTGLFPPMTTLLPADALSCSSRQSGEVSEGDDNNGKDAETEKKNENDEEGEGEGEGGDEAEDEDEEVEDEEWEEAEVMEYEHLNDEEVEDEEWEGEYDEEDSE